MTLSVFQAVIILVIAMILAFIGGAHFGKGKAERPSEAGYIDFVKTEDGNEQCIFKLRDDVDWIEKQDFIIFRVRRGPDDRSP